MSANRSTAVMQRRHPAPDALDYFPTPPWATRALCEFLRERGEVLDAQSCWEPACGEMHMARPLGEYFDRVEATDVFRYSLEHGICDFLTPGSVRHAHWIVTNPPFTLAQQFVEKGLSVAMRGVAMLVRSAFIEGDERHRELFSKLPPSYMLQYVERVTMLQGRLIRTGALDPFNPDDATGEPRKAASATSYCWLIWVHGQSDTRLRWIPKCREKLERPGDYPAYRERWDALAAARAERDGGALL